MTSEKTWVDLPHKILASFDSKTKRNLVGAYDWQMEYLNVGTRSRDKTIKKYRPTISTFFLDQSDRIIKRYKEYFGLKQTSDFPLEKTNDLLAVLFPDSEDLLIREAVKPMHTSGLQKATVDLASIATSEILVDSGLANVKVALKLNELGQRITRVNTSTQRMIRDIVLRGVRDGENVATIGENIRRAGINEYYAGRAQTIVRTETRAAYDVGSKIGLDQTSITKFDVIGCMGTLAGTNELGLSSSYGDFSETTGSCGVLGVDMLLWDAVSSIQHINHSGMAVSAEKL